MGSSFVPLTALSQITIWLVADDAAAAPTTAVPSPEGERKQPSYTKNSFVWSLSVNSAGQEQRDDLHPEDSMQSSAPILFTPDTLVQPQPGPASQQPHSLLLMPSTGTQHRQPLTEEHSGISTDTRQEAQPVQMSLASAGLNSLAQQPNDQLMLHQAFGGVALSQEPGVFIVVGNDNPLLQSSAQLLLSQQPDFTQPAEHSLGRHSSLQLALSQQPEVTQGAESSSGACSHGGATAASMQADSCMAAQRGDGQAALAEGSAVASHIADTLGAEAMESITKWSSGIAWYIQLT